MNEKSQKEVDHLALGLTKSPMFMGINIRLFFCKCHAFNTYVY
jgi:hypothetical protein